MLTSIMGFFLKLSLFLILSYELTTAANAASSDDLAHKQSVQQARAGDYSSAIATLESLANKHQKPNRYFYDLVLILGWAGEHHRVTFYANDISLQDAPRYVLNTLAIAFRQQLNSAAAENVYQVMNERFPSFTDSKIGLGLIFIDQNKFHQAKAMLFPLRDKQPNNISLLNAIAYLHESQERPLQALSIYNKILSIDKKNDSIERKRILTLNKIGSSHLAYSLIKRPSLFSNQELSRIRSDMAAHQIRWGAIPTELENDHFNEIEIAIADVKHNIKDTELSLGQTSLITLNNKFDLLVALRNRYRMQEVLKLYKQLKKSNVKVPPYAQTAACDAFLYLEHPEKSEDCYKEVIRSAQQENINLDLSLFYAYLENEKYPTAKKWIKNTAAKQPLYIRGKGKNPIKRPNTKKTRAETVASLSIAFGDDLDIAEQQIKKLHTLAPYNTDLRKELANIYYWRGWPRKATEEYEIGLTQEPKHVGLRLGQARNLLALKQYNDADHAIQSLYDVYPEDKGIAQQKKLWGIHNMREFKTDISISKSSGAVNGSRGLDISSYLYAAPINRNYRPYIHQRHSQAKFTEGDGLLNHVGIGLEYTVPNIFLMTELHHNSYDDDRLGINLNGEYTFNDYWSTSFSVESLSRNTPLRALNQGVYAKSAAWGGRYRWHESRTTGINLSYQDYSDNNKRKSASAFWNERWYNRYNYKFSTRVDLYTSRNSKTGVIYFNPESDLAGSIALENDWLSWRRYEDTFHQRLILSTGLYKQENFGTGDIWGVQYEHRWASNHRLELIYGIKRSNNRYDGDNELSWSYYLSLDWRF